MIEFRALGALELTGSDGREHLTVLTQPKRVALLTYLVAAHPPRFHRRDLLLALLWPELSEERSRGALRQALHGLRQVMGPEVILSRGDDEVGIAEEALWSDVRSFDRAVAEGDERAALTLYRGDLLNGFHLDGAPEFERWLDAERDRRRRQAAQAARTLAGRHWASGALTEAVPFARQALALGGDETALRELLSLLDTLGDRAGALQEYEAYASRLAEDFQTRPSAETERLMAAVRSRTDSGSAPPPLREADPTPAAAPPLAATRGESRRHRWLWPSLAAVAGLAVLAAGARHFNLARSYGAPRRLVVAPFENRTGDSAFRDLGVMASDWVARGLAETGLVEVASPLVEGVEPGSGVAPVPASGHSAKTAQDLARFAVDNGAGTVVTGAFYRQGDDLRFEAAITDVNRHRLLASVGPATGPAGDPRQAIMALRRAIAGGLAALLDARLGEWAGLSTLPPSYEAYHAFAEGHAKLNRLDARASLQDFARAAAMDTGFALPLVETVHAEVWLGQCTSADSLILKLTAPGKSLAPFDRLRLERLAAVCRGDSQGQYRTSRALADRFPGSEYLAFGVGRDALLLDRPAEARRVLERLHPDRGALAASPFYYLFLGIALHQLGDHERELESARRARRQYPDNIAAIRYQLFPLAALGRVGAIDTLLSEAVAQPAHPLRTPDELMRDAALELRAHGYREAAGRLLERALEWLDRRPNGEPDTESGRLARLKTLYAAERWEEARSLAEAMATEHPDSATYLGLSGALAAHRGDRPRMAAADRALGLLAQPGSQGQATYWRACIAAQAGDRDRAVALLIQARDEPRRHAAEYFMTLHTDPCFGELRGYPPFDEFIRPKG